jgi:hypothetical protein
VGVTAAQPTPGWRSLSKDPGHAQELAVLNTLPLLSPRVTQWQGEQVTDDSPERVNRLARRTLRRSVGQARRAGAITGSSFYVGMAPAVTMIYFEQLRMVLRIAAIYGRDPEDPARAAEILVFQRRYQTVAEADAALRSAGHPKSRDHQPPWTRRTWIAVKQLPQMIGLQLRRIKYPFDVVIWAAEVAAFFVPLMSIPVWTYATGVSTKRLGRAAIEHYQRTSTGSDPTTTIVLPKPPTTRVRRRLVASLVAVIAALAIVAPFIPLGKVSHFLPLGGIVLAEFSLLWAGIRLVLITRPVSTDRPEVAPASPGDRQT